MLVLKYEPAPKAPLSYNDYYYSIKLMAPIFNVLFERGALYSWYCRCSCILYMVTDINCLVGATVFCVQGNLIMSDIGLPEKRVYHAALNGNNSLPSVLHRKDD